jgi:hypothetical protein
VLIFNIQIQPSIHIASWRGRSDWSDTEGHSILWFYFRIQASNIMASYYEGPHFDVTSAQEYYQGYDEYGQPSGRYDSNGQLLSQSLEHGAASFLDIDNAISAEIQLPGQTVHPNFNQSSSDVFDPASNHGFSTAPSTMISHYNPPIYTNNLGYQAQEQHPLQQNLIPAEIAASNEPGMDAGDMFQSGPQPMDYWYSDPSQSGYLPSMDSISPEENMLGTLFYPEPQAASFPDLAEACGSIHHPSVPVFLKELTMCLHR